MKALIDLLRSKKIEPEIAPVSAGTDITVQGAARTLGLAKSYRDYVIEMQSAGQAPVSQKEFLAGMR